MVDFVVLFVMSSLPRIIPAMHSTLPSSIQALSVDFSSGSLPTNDFVGIASQDAIISSVPELSLCHYLIMSRS